MAASAGPAATIHLDPSDGACWPTARSALDEARVYEREGDLASAIARARDARVWPDRCATTPRRLRRALRRCRDARALAALEGRDHRLVAARGARGHRGREGRAPADAVRARRAGEDLQRSTSGFNWIADKAREGDGATPEGRYRIVSRRAAGAFYKALLLDYPNAEDRAEFSRARRSGEPPAVGRHRRAHRDPRRRRPRAATGPTGCVAVTNPDMDDLFGRVGVGTPVTIVGSDDFGAIAEFAAQYRDGRAGRQH